MAADGAALGSGGDDDGSGADTTAAVSGSNDGGGVSSGRPSKVSADPMAFGTGAKAMRALGTHQTQFDGTIGGTQFGFEEQDGEYEKQSDGSWRSLEELVDDAAANNVVSEDTE